MPHEGLIGFEGAGRRTTTRLLEGDLPKYRTLFPTEFNSVAVIETAPFVEAVKRVALVAERNTPVRLSFEQGVLILEAGSSDDAQAVERVDAVLEGDDISIAFNPTFLLDGLSAIDSPVAQLSFTTSTKPALLSGRLGRRRRGGRRVQVPDHAGPPLRLTRRSFPVTAVLGGQLSAERALRAAPRRAVPAGRRLGPRYESAQRKRNL